PLRKAFEGDSSGKPYVVSAGVRSGPRRYNFTMSSEGLTSEKLPLPGSGSAFGVREEMQGSRTRRPRLRRIIIYAKDIQCITGKSERYGRMMLQRVRIYFNKAEHQLITIDEFCEYAGLRSDQVSAFLD